MKILKDNPLQDKEELKWYTKLTMDLGVRKYLEIGSYEGGTTYAVLANSPASSLGVSIDLNHNSFNIVKEELTTLGYDIRTYTGDSKDVSIIEQVRKLSPYDLVFIDGDHTYEGVKTDWYNYGSLAPVVVIHDVCGRDNPYTHDVWKFWQELKMFKPYIEVNFSDYQLGYGVIFNAV